MRPSPCHTPSMPSLYPAYNTHACICYPPANYQKYVLHVFVCFQHCSDNSYTVLIPATVHCCWQVWSIISEMIFIALLKEVWIIKPIPALLEFQSGHPEPHWWKLLSQKQVRLWIGIYTEIYSWLSVCLIGVKSLRLLFQVHSYTVSSSFL